MLKPILTNLIFENQSAFVSSRAISDHVMITHEVFHFLQSTGTKKYFSMAMKTDMRKTYDRLEWDFVRLVFKMLSFHSRLINWVMLSVSMVTYTSLINDTPRG